MARINFTKMALCSTPLFEDDAIFIHCVTRFTKSSSAIYHQGFRHIKVLARRSLVADIGHHNVFVKISITIIGTDSMLDDFCGHRDVEQLTLIVESIHLLKSISGQSLGLAGNLQGCWLLLDFGNSSNIIKRTSTVNNVNITYN